MSEDVRKEIEEVVTDVYKALDVLGTTKLKEMNEGEFSERFGVLADDWAMTVKKIQNQTKKDGRFQGRLGRTEKGFAKLARLDFSVLQDGEQEKMLNFLVKKINEVETKIKSQFQKKEKRAKDQEKFQF